MNKHFLALILLLMVCSCHKEQTIPVEIDVVLHIMNDNHTSPLAVVIENRTQYANSFLWTFKGGEPATSTMENPGTVVFTAPGEHAITLEAWNDGDRASKTYTIRVDSAVTAAFRADVDINNYAPATYRITNLSSGGSSYRWTFEGGEPSSFEGRNPPAITYVNEGRYTIRLTIDNGSATFASEQEITVRESLDASFAIIPSPEDEDDMEAPLRATFETWLQGVETLSWECVGAVITDNTSPDASIYFPAAGQYTVYLNVSNGKETKRVSQSITVKENTNLRTHEDIRLGINTARETIGSAYSTRLKRVFRTSEINKSNGSAIDIVFFGLNVAFSYNQFVSPDKLEATSLPDIPNALPTKFINRTELGLINLTPAQFESMTTDALLKELPIATAEYGNEYFTGSPLPRVVLFETADGRKGAILVKEMVSGGTENSYIIVDIKVQKND